MSELQAANGASDRWPVLRGALLAAVLVVFLGRIVLTYRVFNDTFDEAIHISAGLEILERGTYSMEAQHPPLGRFMVAVLPYHLAGLRLGHLNELWGHGMWGTRDLSFYWRSLALARAGNLLFAAILFYFVYRWSSELYGKWPAVGACALVACSPTLLAHAGVATLDIGAAATVLAAAYFLWRWAEQPGLQRCMTAAFAFGLAAITKFSALVFLPPIAVLYFVAARRVRWKSKEFAAGAALKRAAPTAVVFCTVFAMTVWAGYLFRVGTSAPAGHQYISPFFSEQGSLARRLWHAVAPKKLPAQMFVLGMIEVLDHNEAGQTNYLLGQVSRFGHWYYFPLCLALKSTLPMLLFATIGIAAARRTALSPLIGVAVVLAASMAADINIGERHMLAVYPFLAITGAGAFASGRRAVRMIALVLLAWHAGESIAAHPDYLAYFNEMARGRGEHFLADSNLDWGQDLARLGQYVREHGIESVQLSYFGRSDPAKFGVKAAPLDAAQPPPGWIAVSVTNLVMKDELAWLRKRTPQARVGKSIRLYYWASRPNP